MISQETLLFVRDVLARQQLSAEAPDLVQTAIAVKKALTELDQAIAEIGEVEIT